MCLCDGVVLVMRPCRHAVCSACFLRLSPRRCPMCRAPWTDGAGLADGSVERDLDRIRWALARLMARPTTRDDDTPAGPYGSAPRLPDAAARTP